MVDQASKFTLHGLAYRCRQETDRFWQNLSYNPHYCLELFRCALAKPHHESSKKAWSLIHQQYHRQVTLWVKRHRSLSQTDMMPETLADLTLEKMWVSFASMPDKLDSFPLANAEQGLQTLLRYLLTCVNSVIIDAIQPEAEANIDDIIETGKPNADPIVAEEFWQVVYRRLKNDKERLVVDAYFAYGLKPRHIYTAYPEMFGDIKEIHRIKENVLTRFKRDASLLAYL